MQRTVLLVVLCCFIGLGSAFRNESESLQCGQNEEVACVNPCPPERTCRNRLIAFRCAESTDPCKKKCVCADGYYRNAIGECITLEQCEQCDAPNEFYSCNSACDNVCENIDTQNRTNCPILNVVCNKWCYCDDGYARDSNGNCVPVDQCQPTCGPNEVWTCKKTCPPETCFSIIAFFNCNRTEICQPRCACKPGYLRPKLGMPCVPTCQCPEIANSPDCKTN